MKPSMSRTTSTASTVLGRKAAVSTTTTGKVDGKQAAAGTSRVVAGSKQEGVTRNRAALGELTNKDATNVTTAGDKPKAGASKTTSAVTGRPIIARRVTRNSLAAADKPAEAVAEPTAGPSRSTITSTARARPLARTRPSTKNVKEEVAAPTVTKREPLTGKATSSTINNARAGIKRTLTATTVVQAPPQPAPVRLERQPSVKREIEEEHDDEKPIQPSSKRIRTSSPVKRDDAEVERFEHEHERAIAEVDETAHVEDVKPAVAVREAGVDALEDEQPYELEDDPIGMSGARLGDIVQDIDADDADDPTMVVEYVQDIFNYMKELEVSCPRHDRLCDVRPC